MENKPEYTEESLNQLFREVGTLKVKFIKADGSERQMICTKDMEKIPKEFHPKPLDPGKEPRKKNPLLCNVFEIGVGWRSFYYAKIISVTPADE